MKIHSPATRRAEEAARGPERVRERGERDRTRPERNATMNGIIRSAALDRPNHVKMDAARAPEVMDARAEAAQARAEADESRAALDQGSRGTRDATPRDPRQSINDAMRRH